MVNEMLLKAFHLCSQIKILLLPIDWYKWCDNWIKLSAEHSMWPTIRLVHMQRWQHIDAPTNSLIAEATWSFQRLQIYIQTNLTLSCWRPFESSCWVLSYEYQYVRVAVLFQFFSIISFWTEELPVAEGLTLLLWLNAVLNSMAWKHFTHSFFNV